jgi:choline dehydrogenase-like flavoprotein
MRAAIGKLGDNARLMRAFPLLPLLRSFNPGKGNHFGGSFPMRREPGAFESDALGRPAGLRRVHVVDATIFPSFPATTVTFTVMANAHRIASQVVEAGET